MSCVCVFLMFLLTLSSAFDSLVVSPPISTVMPLILFAMRFHLLREGMKKAPAEASAFLLKCDFRLIDKVNDIFRREVVIYLIGCGYFDFFQ